MSLVVEVFAPTVPKQTGMTEAPSSMSVEPFMLHTI